MSKSSWEDRKTEEITQTIISPNDHNYTLINLQQDLNAIADRHHTLVFGGFVEN